MAFASSYARLLTANRDELGEAVVRQESRPRAVVIHVLAAWPEVQVAGRQREPGTDPQPVAGAHLQRALAGDVQAVDVARHGADPVSGGRGHLTPDYLKSEIDRLVFTTPAADPSAAAAQAVAVANRSPLATPVLQGASESHQDPSMPGDEVCVSKCTD